MFRTENSLTRPSSRFARNAFVSSSFRFQEFLHVLEDKGGNFRKSRGNKATKDAVVYYYICNRVRADSNAELDDKRSTKSDSVVYEEEENTENEDELRIDEDSVELKNGPKPIKCRKNGKSKSVIAQGTMTLQKDRSGPRLCAALSTEKQPDSMGSSSFVLTHFRDEKSLG